MAKKNKKIEETELLGQKETEKPDGVQKALTAAILILAVAILGAGAYFWYLMEQKPTMVIGSAEASVEAGEIFDEWSMVKSLDHVTEEQVEIDLGKLDTQVPGTYEVTYKLKTSRGEETLPVNITVADTIPPELTLVEETQTIKVGTSVELADLVLSVTDKTEVSCAFEDGSTSHNFTEAGEYTLTVVAADKAGNESRGEVHFLVEELDVEAPHIYGAVNTAVKVGDSFDVYAGIIAEDDADPAPLLKADVETVDTSRTGSVVVHYTATDNTGKQETAERTVTVADDVYVYEDRRFGVFWDLTGVEGQPYLAAVNRVANTVTIYMQDADGRYTVPVQAFACSTGPATPEGYYKTLERYRWQYLYEDCWGQYATRIVGHILFHSVPYHTQNPADLEYEEYNLLGTPASLGCIRMQVSDVKWIYDNCPNGFPCVIYDDAVTDGPLGKPETLKIPEQDLRRGWDPTDPDPNNPWNQ